MQPNKTIASKTFIELFNIILSGNKDDSRKSAREVRKLLYSSRDGGKYDDIKKIVENAPDEYRKIKEEWREENFVVAVSVLYYLHNRENQPDFLFSWLFYLLLHKNGNIRQSAVRMIGHELGPLTVHIRCPEHKQRKLKSEQSDFILLNLFVALNNLLASLWKPEYKKYKYVDSLPACPYKSIQMVFSKMENDCGKEYMKQLKTNKGKNKKSMKIEIKEEILERRKEIELEISEMLEETKSDFKLQDVKDAIFNEEDQDDFMHIVAMFDRGGDASELSNALELVTDAWNYFPHKALDGLSPAEQNLESL